MRGWERLLCSAICAASAACAPAGEDAAPRPSLLLVVLDTTRRDAVSAYGAVEDTTPYLDALARAGQRYEWALAPSPWTPPSHATLFTSVGAERHGVGVGGRMVLGDRLETLAERLRDAGYQTAGFSENPLVGRQLGLARGFDLFVGEEDATQVRRATSNAKLRFEIVPSVARWAGERDPERPFFVFVNLFDPHDPYDLHEPNPFLPAGTNLDRARRAGRGVRRSHGVAEFAGICSRLPDPGELAILRALYLGEVRAADAKLETIHRALSEVADGHLVSVVTADHGEHLGEHRLLGHEFSLRNELLRVPLVVHGPVGAPPAVIEARVGLRDIAPSLLAWTGLEAPAAWAGRTLPLRPAADEPERAWLASFSDAPRVGPQGVTVATRIDRKRRGCSEPDRVFGAMLSILRFPFKLVWYEQTPAQLYDLRWDERELADVAEHHPEQLAALRDELLGWRQVLREAAAAPDEPLTEEAREALRALGYVE